MNSINTIAFDADDTLWVNEPYFQEAEIAFCELLEEYLPHDTVSKELLDTEIRNLHLYGYGVKGFMLSMVETATRISKGAAPLSMIDKIIAIGHDLLQKPVELLDGVAETLDQLKGKYRLVVATKGDLLDQERKLKKSGLQNYFHHIEIMSDKRNTDYQKLIRHLDCRPENFLMIGNSIKSDILPVLENGGYAAHIPYHITWAHEHHEHKPESERFMEFKNIREVLECL
ncbi:putative hydrolase of the HAD superfamily [Chryseobacterium sp. SORGH_AS909]|uniref:Hydrolase of the HAD superfamily n=2 Tax=Chryseobacterium group TaxID=2782232 RepID=A0ABU0TG36_9FLAO|nr:MULTISPECIES: HAD family hydrolase [Chryseobacterium]MDT3406171.1 putative hydrolase of the HAD superfamily [Pseudacidovorax intermedius]MDQ1096027.1 putative hydrolase of the HAD superfamily [Chryseobacterium camelliae]MDQ1099963.1 putative hydrolase of the HAD superfamily [Chryseobacterium sp. SORGH_AS_1048]MDR6087309.1 putative hydrolase of the HAD superfamily [Chryseobacterium sp. SORGH_AS_0909]MDR6131683.1 putative hydrolase of the HAD superfamily [Chryseobacterium sp. SORGH_AS_1175]